MPQRRTKEEIRKGLIEIGEKPGSKELEKLVEDIYEYEKLQQERIDEEQRRKAGLWNLNIKLKWNSLKFWYNLVNSQWGFYYANINNKYSR